MEFEIKNIQKSINDLMRTIGYQPAYFQKEGSAFAKAAADKGVFYCFALPKL